MIVRTFLDKNNTIISDSYANTGRNPVAELFYGDKGSFNEYSRLLIHFDESRLRELYTGGTFTDLTKLTHRLKMVNTTWVDERLLNTTVYGKDRTSSFDLIVFPIDRTWDEGIGYDSDVVQVVAGESSFDITPSNWFSATTLSAWDTPGLISGSTTGATIAEQHFQFGNEHMDMDLTDHINGIITGDTNHGFAIAFKNAYELLETDIPQYVGFFTRHTNTVYVPYIETTYTQHIKDDRNDFFLDKDNKLYLYVNLGGTPTNLDSIPTVTIRDNNGDVVSAYTQSGVTHVTTGVYSINLNLSSNSGFTEGSLFTDTWSGVTINGVSRPVIELDFEIKAAESWFNIGANTTLPKKIVTTISGLNRGENIKRGDIRKVIVTNRIPYTVNQSQQVDDVKYRLYIKEGRNDYTVTDWHSIEMTTNHNYFLLDTLSLTPATYHLDMKVISNLEVTTYDNVIEFTVVGESENRLG